MKWLNPGNWTEPLFLTSFHSKLSIHLHSLPLQYFGMKIKISENKLTRVWDSRCIIHYNKYHKSIVILSVKLWRTPVNEQERSRFSILHIFQSILHSPNFYRIKPLNEVGGSVQFRILKRFFKEIDSKIVMTIFLRYLFSGID